jgi:hypothetical protein
MSAATAIYAALIFPDCRDLTTKRFYTCVRNALMTHDLRIGAVPVMSDDGMTLIGDSFAVRMTFEEASVYGPRVSFHVVTHEDAQSETQDRAAALLSKIILNGLARSNADMIEWMAPDALLTRDEVAELPQFKTAVEDAQPVTWPTHRNLRGTARAAGASDHDDAAPHVSTPIDAKRVQPDAERRLSAASWLMPGMLGFVSPPVAGSVAVVNAARGGDIRLTTQALSLTACAALLAHHGAFAHVTHLFH